MYKLIVIHPERIMCFEFNSLKGATEAKEIVERFQFKGQILTDPLEEKNNAKTT